MSDTRTIVVSIVGTGLATVTVMVAFTAIIASGINARFDDLASGINARFDDLASGINARFDDVNRRIDDVNRRIDDVNRNVNGRIDDLDARMTRVEADIRELRTLVIEAIEGKTAPD